MQYKAFLLLLLGCSTVEGELTTPFGEVPLYDRAEWKHWVDEDKDCQDARTEVLIRDSRVPVTFKDERQCQVIAGEWEDVYSTTVIVEGRYVDVDHMVALSDAHESGGYAWSPEQKEKFANDISHLVVSSRSTNRSKGERGPDEWLPPLDVYRCPYIKDWLAVKTKYELSQAEGENAVISYMQKICADGLVPPLPQN